MPEVANSSTPAAAKVAKTATDKKKRGHYEKRECPYCHKMVGNLGNHVKQSHPTEQPGQQAPVTKETILGSSKPVSPIEVLKVKYYCLGCKGVVRKGEATCWQCGQQLNWEGIE